MLGRPTIDLTGRRYGMLTVLGKSSRPDLSKRQRWDCVCDCGTTKSIPGSDLPSLKSCGCFRDKATGDRARTHGLSKTIEYKMWKSAKQRAKKRGLEFDIELSDIVIPAICPVLGIAMTPGTMKSRDSSPSLDRTDSSVGYTKGNVSVISFKANTMKGCGTAEEHRRIAEWVESQHLLISGDDLDR